jgi:hypothetical protein
MAMQMYVQTRYVMKGRPGEKGILERAMVRMSVRMARAEMTIVKKEEGKWVREWKRAVKGSVWAAWRMVVWAGEGEVRRRR